MRISPEDLGEFVAGEVGRAGEFVDGLCDVAAELLIPPVPVLDGHISGLKGLLTHMLPCLPLDDVAFLLEAFGLTGHEVEPVQAVELALDVGQDFELLVYRQAPDVYHRHPGLGRRGRYLPL